MRSLEAHSLWAPSYDAAPNAVLSLEGRIVAGLLPPVENRVVVDAGCGTGRWLEELAARGAQQVFGFDECMPMVQRAARKGIPRAGVVSAVCTAIPLAEACADLVLCSFVVSYVRDRRRFGLEAARILKPGGAMIVSDLHPGGRERGWRRTFRHGGSTVEIDTYGYTAASLHALFESCGLMRTGSREPSFGEEERRIFEHAGKSEEFDRCAGVPAILVHVYRKARSGDAGLRTP